METENCYEAVRRPPMDRLWRWLGFGHPGRDYMEDLDDAPGFAPSRLDTDVFIHMDWRDRLRVLISGKVMATVSTKTDVIVDRAISRTKVGVLPPNVGVKR